MPCYYQVFASERHKIGRWGKCEICTEDKENGDCLGYFKICPETFEVIDANAEIEEAR